MINPEIRRLHMLKRAHAKSKVKKTKKKVNAGKTSFYVQYEHGPCLICGNTDASKTNSHIVPSFLVDTSDSINVIGFVFTKCHDYPNIFIPL